MNQMEEALYRCGAHIVFKEVRKPEAVKEPTHKMKVPIPIWRKRGMSKVRNQVVIGGVALDPVDQLARIVTSPANPIHHPPS